MSIPNYMTVSKGTLQEKHEGLEGQDTLLQLDQQPAGYLHVKKLSFNGHFLA